MMTRCSIWDQNGMLLFTSPYNPAMVELLKTQIPASARKPHYNGRDFAGWLVAPPYGKTLQDLAEKFYCEQVNLPVISQQVIKSSLQSLKMLYIGACKDRGGGEYSSFGYIENEGWSALFSQAVLQQWFEAIPGLNETTYYSTLGVKNSASTDEIRSAYRRMALQWHPDRCREQDAQETFMRIQKAYEILSTRRGRYDAGLALQNSVVVEKKTAVNIYRPPLRSGYILCEARPEMGRKVVEKILAWEDIKLNGKTLVSSWPMGAKEPTITWVEG